YRIPSPAEFRMLCNIGLLRGAKGVFPYSIRSYSEWDDDTLLHHDTGLLDEDLIPFDAPYEDWVYRERPTGDYFYAPPDSIPPWTAADHSQFDPLYSLPSRPVNVPGSQRNIENYLLWKFAAYGRLWNSVSATFRQIAWVAPELSRLWWWFSSDRYDKANIFYDGTEPQYFAEPHIRVFTDSTESTCYLFYVNRFCRANENPFEVRVNAFGFPQATPFSEYALDHSRRFLIHGDSTAIDMFTFLDTLDAGEARLLQMFDNDTGLAADLRITDPDLCVVRVADGDTLTDYSGYDSVSVNIRATCYNMGTSSLSNVRVYLKDLTTDEVLDTVSISIDGLDTNYCRQCARAVAAFDTWTPDADDIGIHVFEIYTEDITGEPDPSDNSASLVYMVKPSDYANEILGDPWDMTEATSSIPAWYTNDIDTLTGCWGGYTDSISGMFEGTLSNPANANALYLNTGSGRDDWIDADRFVNLSLAGYAEHGLSIEAHWMDSDSNGYFVDIQEDLGPTASDIGPVDLSSLSANWTGDVIAFWLEFTGSNLVTGVRIGWVKLTE
ncbi:MAG TPA: hypothetical protein P5207_02890, partial [Candidatus Sabulitectum sp.]|nr:hypothetical protein [Candidatus Sabulitectum sp.]